MATLWGWRAGTMGLGGLLIPLLFLGVADSQLVLSVGPSPVRAALGSDVQLPCTFTVTERFEIIKFYLAWSLGGHRVAEYIREQRLYQQGSELFPEELSRGNCSLLLRQVAVRDGGRYTSTIIYTPDKEEKQLELQVTAAPRLSIPRKAGVLNAATSFPCHVWGFYPGDVTVTWLRDGRVLTDATRSAPQRNPDGTFNLTLTHTFTPTASDSGSNFSCHVTHAALAQPLREEFPLVIGAPPRISVPRRLAVRNTETYFPCHVWGFYPRDVTVTWLRDGRVLTDVTRSAPQRNPDGTFNLTAIYMFTPIESDSGSIFSCRVSHAALAQPLREEFPLAVTEAHGSTTALTAVLGISVTLAVGMTALATYFWCRWKGRCAPTSTGGKVPYSDSEVPDGKVSKSVSKVLVPGDAMEGTFPEDTAVTWERIHGQDRMLIGTDGVSKAGEGPEHQPLLHPQPQRWRATQERSGTCLMDNGARDSCSFHHEARGIREQRESGEIRPWAQPQVSGIQVLPHWEPQDEVPFAVQIQNFYPSEIHWIQWSCDGKTWEKCEPIDSSQNPDLTFSATSVWRIPSHQITRPEFTVTVSVQQSPQSPAIEREIRAGDTDLLRPPEVSEISQPESVTAGEEITLSCRMTGHFPGALSVTWLRRDRGAGAAVSLQGSAEYRIEPGAPRTQDGKSFQQETRLSFTPSVQRDQGAEYVCQVGHVALQTALERRSRELQVTGLLRPPEVSEISQPESVMAGEEITLSCCMVGHFPGELSVTWFRKEKSAATSQFMQQSKGDTLVPLKNSPAYRIDPGTPRTQDVKSFQQETRLSFTPLVQRDQGAEYVCRVGHVTLQTPLERRSRELQVTVPQAPVLGEISQPQVLTHGEQVTLSCRISGFYPKELRVTWHRRGRGESAFRCLDNLDTHKIVTTDPTAAPDGKSYSVTSHLCLTPVVPEDDGAEYRCSVEHQTLQEPKAKSTGPLELRVPQAPVLGEISRPQVLTHGEQVTLSCQISKFYPKELSMTWYRQKRGETVFRCLDNLDTHKIVTPDPTAAPDRKSYSVTSQLHFTPVVPEDDGAEYLCSVEHQTLQEPEGKSTGLLELRGVLRPPEVSEISQPESVTAGEEITLSCRMTGHFPGELSVTWLREGRGAGAAVPLQGSAEYRIEPGAPHTQDGKSFQQETKLSFTPSVQRDQGAEYVCRVGHVALQTALERRSRELQVTVPPQVSKIQVLPQWEPPEEVPFAVQIQNFYPRGIHRIQWSCGDTERWKDESPEISENPDLTFSATSVWRIPSQRLIRPERSILVFIQQSPEGPSIKREIRAGDTGLLRPPEVSEISQPESVTAGEEITLSCRMTGHFPAALTVTWLRRDQGAGAAVRILNSAEYRIDIGAPHTQDGKSFQQETRLSFTPSVQRDQGAEYVCRVGHVALQTPLERRSRELQVTGGHFPKETGQHMNRPAVPPRPQLQTTQQGENKHALPPPKVQDSAPAMIQSLQHPPMSSAQRASSAGYVSSQGPAPSRAQGAGRTGSLVGQRGRGAGFPEWRRSHSHH